MVKIKRLFRVGVIRALIIIVCFHLSFSACSNDTAESTKRNTEEIEYAMEISQHGITWYFDKAYEYGQFVNGDWWVVGPVAIVDIDPASIDEGGRVLNGSMINPLPATHQMQGFDSTFHSLTGEYYDPDLNVGLGITSISPLMLMPGESLVSSLSNPAAAVKPQLDSVCVLTCVAQRPASGSFRPPYAGDSKDYHFNISTVDANAALLKNFDPVADTPDITAVTSQFDYLWLDHMPSNVDEYIHHSHMPTYGNYLSQEISTAAMMLHLRFDADDAASYQIKRSLLIRFIQYGIDTYGILQLPGGNGLYWSNGGHAPGRPFPVIFAGVMLNHNGMMTICEKTGNYAYNDTSGTSDIKSPLPDDYIHFGEHDGVFNAEKA